MIKIGHVREVETLEGVPSEIVDVIRDAVTILDTEYGESRDVGSGYGGYVLLIEEEDELEKLKDIYIDLEIAIPEYVDVIECVNGQIFTSSLILMGNDFGAVIVMPLLLLPKNLREYIFE